MKHPRLGLVALSWSLASSLALSAFTFSGCAPEEGGLFGESGAGGATEGATEGATGGSAGSSGAGTGGEAVAGAGGAAACEAVEVSPERVTTYLEFAIDSSASMAESGKWAAVQDGFSLALAAYPDSVKAGATVFPGIPNTTNEYCYAATQNIPFSTVDGAHAGLFENLFSAHTPGGGSPTHPAVRFGYQQLDQAAAVEPGLRALVLITDGQGNLSFGESGEMGTNCSGDGRNRSSVSQDALVEEGRAAAAQGTYTFAVGLPGTEGGIYADVLSAIAREGGTAPADCGPNDCHVDLSPAGSDLAEWVRLTVSELGPALQSCAYPVPESDAHDLDALIVEYEGDGGTEPLSATSDCVNEPGYLLDAGYVYLCGETCSRSQDEGGAVQLKLPCL
jgi:hypothetical protein